MTKDADGKNIVITLGTYPEMTLAQARAAMETAKEKHKAAREFNELETKKGTATVNDLADAFHKRRLKPHLRSADHVKRIIELHILQHIGTRKLTTITTVTCRKLVEQIVDAGNEPHAKTVLARLKQMLDFAVSRGDLEFNPAAPLKAANLGITTTSRNRFLTAEEIRDFYQALEQHRRLSIQTKLAFRILLLTGVRSGELLKAQWSNVNLNPGTWTIPVTDQKISKKREKDARPFVIPLAAQVIELFRQAKTAADKSPFVMGTSEDTKQGRVEDKVLGHALRRMFATGKLQMDPFTPHDLRRTMRTHLGQALRVAPHIAERCLNHTLGKMIETYDVGDYLEERREAMERWADQVDIYTGKVENVVAFVKEVG
jgi:integrase